MTGVGFGYRVLESFWRNNCDPGSDLTKGTSHIASFYSVIVFLTMNSNPLLEVKKRTHCYYTTD